jgi:hypothetical protein
VELSMAHPFLIKTQPGIKGLPVLGVGLCAWVSWP